MKIRAEKDFWSGIMFLGFAAVAMVAARGYSTGTTGRMGPGYFPILLAIVLAVLAVTLIARSFVIGGERTAQIKAGPLALIVAATCVFGLTVERLGLVVSIALVSTIAALAARESRVMEIVGLAAVLVALSVGIFVYALRLPLPVWPAF
jgi:hypothetical protein